MKKILLFLITIICVSCSGHKSNPAKFAENIDMKITSMNYNSSLTDDKFHTPQLCNIILFETLSEPILYREFNTCSYEIISFFNFYNIIT